MSEFPEQDLALELLGNYEIVEKYPNGDLLISVTGNYYLVTTEGDMYEEKAPRPGGKAPKAKKKPKDKGEKKPPAYDYPIGYTYKTVCTRRPELCAPRDIQMVCFDADDTIWHISSGIASGITGRLEKIDEDTVIAHPSAPPPTKPAKPAPKGTPPPKREHRWWKQRPLFGSSTEPLHKQEEELESWWESTMGREEEDDELEAIATELTKSLSPKEKEMLEVIGEVKGEEVKLLPIGKEAPAEPLTSPTTPSTEPYDYYYPSYWSKKEPVTIKLLPTFRDTLKELEDRGIQSSIISLNTPGSVSRILEAFGLADKFTEINDTWQGKGKVFEALCERNKLNPCNALFVDDSISHVEDVSTKCGLGLVIGKGKDVEKPADILRYIKE